MTGSAFVKDDQITNVVIAVKNRNAIADLVLPRTAPLGKEEFTHMVYASEQHMTLPDTKVGRRSKVNKVDFSGEEIQNRTDDYGLEHALPKSDIMNAPAGHDPRMVTGEWLANLVELDREVRAAKLVGNAANYGTNTDTLTGGSQFNNDSFDALGYMLEMLDTPIMRPNIITFGQDGWREFRTNPFVVKAVHKNDGDSGVAAMKAVAELLEVDAIYVGKSMFNVAKPGQQADIQRAWGNFVAMHYRDEIAARAKGMTWGFTGEFGQRVAWTKASDNIGLRGGEIVRVGESVKEVVAAPELGFLVQNVVA